MSRPRRDAKRNPIRVLLGISIIVLAVMNPDTTGNLANTAVDILAALIKAN